MFSISPFFFLIGVIILCYLSANSVTDIYTARYTLALFLSYGVGIGCVLEFMKKQTGFITRSRVAGVAFALLIVLNIKSNSLELSHASEPDALEGVAKYLLDKKVNYGYGFYWYSYAINLLTNENVILDPLGTNYTPYYREKVQGANRIAYVDKHPYILGDEIQINQHIKIFDKNYRILEKQLFNSLDVFILERT